MTAKVCCRAQPFGLALNVIIVSVSSAEAIQPVRTDRYTLAHRRSPAARSNTAGHANTRPISVHTGVLTLYLPGWSYAAAPPTARRVDVSLSDGRAPPLMLSSRR